MIGEQDIIEATYVAICKVYGITAALRFNDLIRNTNGGADLTLSDLKPSVQIDRINSFWRNQLVHIPNSTEVRSWLCAGTNIDTYINSFETNWLVLIWNTGILS